MESLQSLLENESIKGALIISRLAGGEVIESAIKESDSLQTLLEMSLDYLEKFMNYKMELSKYSTILGENNLKKITIELENYIIDFTEVKNDDIFLIVVYDKLYPKGINELYIKMALEYTSNSY